MSGKQIKLFLVDGTAGGLTTAEITNWTGHVLSARRSDLAELLKREEAQRTGVYLLLGDDEAAIGDTRCYIGEADVVADRLRYHQREKDFWDRVILITSKDTNLTKSHGRYLESRLISLATEAKRVSMENSTAPPVPALPGGGRVRHGLLPLAAADSPAGAGRQRHPRQVSRGGQRPVAWSWRVARVLPPAHQGRRGRASQQIDGEFTMLTGSVVVPVWHGVGKAESTIKAYAAYRAQHEQLVADGAIAIEDGIGRLTRDIVFTSPSTAGAVALGRSCNGRLEWIFSEGAFGQWESRGVDLR